MITKHWLIDASFGGSVLGSFYATTDTGREPLDADLCRVAIAAGIGHPGLTFRSVPIDGRPLDVALEVGMKGEGSQIHFIKRDTNGCP